MSYLFFEANELDILHEMINTLQIYFHPIYVREGQFSVRSTFELQYTGKNISIIMYFSKQSLMVRNLGTVTLQSWEMREFNPLQTTLTPWEAYCFAMMDLAKRQGL